MTAKPYHFDAALKELESITQWFEQGEIDLDEGLTKFERGMELANELTAHLETVENRVEKIRQRFSDGVAQAEPTVETAEDTDEPTGLFA